MPEAPKTYINQSQYWGRPIMARRWAYQVNPQKDPPIMLYGWTDETGAQWNVLTYYDLDDRDAYMVERRDPAPGAWWVEVQHS